MIDLLGLATVLLGIHFGVPLCYFAYLKEKDTGIPRNLEAQNYSPKVTVVVPTFNEKRTIRRKLDNLKNQDFARSRLEVLIVDSGSDDGTADLAEEWKQHNPDFPLRIVREPVRVGKVQAMNFALSQSSGELIVFSDADCVWAADALRNSVAYFSDPEIGAVTGVKEPISTGKPPLESVYRGFYNRVRIMESMIYSTPIFNGELAAFRKSTLESLGGFPSGIGADDSHMATLMASGGHRAIAAPNVLIYEEKPITVRATWSWRRRRAKHLVYHFAVSAKKVFSAPRGFRMILAAEAYIHLINPWLLTIGIGSLLAAWTVADFPPWGWILFGASVLVLPLRQLREPFLVWVTNQFILSYAAIAGILAKELVWTKIE
jgi:cellulose synthase/poly-beta-1,6-N-acetylglucosamine synthase-like glycosyltransferase